MDAFLEAAIERTFSADFDAIHPKWHFALALNSPAKPPHPAPPVYIVNSCNELILSGLARKSNVFPAFFKFSEIDTIDLFLARRNCALSQIVTVIFVKSVFGNRLRTESSADSVFLRIAGARTGRAAKTAKFF